MTDGIMKIKLHYYSFERIRENISCVALGMIPWYSLAPPSMVYVFPEPVQKKHVHTCVYLYTHFSLQRKLTRIVSKNIAMSTPN